MIVDAIILAGGRSSRLGGEPKHALVYDDSTLLSRTVAAAKSARARLVVVVAGQNVEPPAGTIVTHEHPPYSGPAAGIGAGLRALFAADDAPSDYVLVLACDMPGVSHAVAVLTTALAGLDGQDGVIALDEDDRMQPLAAIYDSERLEASVSARESRAALPGLSVFALIDGLRLLRVRVPTGSTHDIDTLEDLRRFGMSIPSHDAVREQQ